MKKRMNIPKEELINSVLLFYKSNPNNFNLKSYKKNGDFSEAVIIRHFKKWSNMCEELNLPYAKRNRFSKEDILNDIKQVIESTGNTRRDNYLKFGKYSKSTFEKYIGSWNFILNELNHKINMHKKITKEEVTAEMLRLHEKHGYFTAKLQREESIYSQSIIDTHFGTFSNMLVELELRAPYSKVITNQEIIDDLKNIYDKYGSISCDIIDEFSIVSVPTVISRFGNMQIAYEAAGIYCAYDLGSQSKLSKYVLNICTDIIGEKPKLEHIFPWLINPKTGKRLRVDAFYPNANIVIEVDGAQHYNDIRFRQGADALEIIQYRDNVKNTLIPEHNIKFLRIPYNFSLQQIIDAANAICE